MNCYCCSVGGMALWTAIFFYVVYPSNELGDQLQETEQRESELASKSHELEEKLLCKIREAAEEVERKVGLGLKCVVCNYPHGPPQSSIGWTPVFLHL